jgi:hypothetical protein
MSQLNPAIAAAVRDLESTIANCLARLDLEATEQGVSVKEHPLYRWLKEIPPALQPLKKDLQVIAEAAQNPQTIWIRFQSAREEVNPNLEDLRGLARPLYGRMISANVSRLDRPKATVEARFYFYSLHEAEAFVVSAASSKCSPLVALEVD